MTRYRNSRYTGSHCLCFLRCRRPTSDTRRPRRLAHFHPRLRSYCRRQQIPAKTCNTTTCCLALDSGRFAHFSTEAGSSVAVAGVGGEQAGAAFYLRTERCPTLAVGRGLPYASSSYSQCSAMKVHHQRVSGKFLKARLRLLLN